MPKVKGKVQLCTCDKYETYFKSFQGLEGSNYSLFDRYSDIENVVNKNVNEKYRHFLAQPEIDGDTIFWFSTPYRNNTPRQLTTLRDEEHKKYEQIKNDTLNHYHNVVQSLKQQGKNSEAECLEKAIKFVNDDFVYCYDDKAVLGVWGMQLRENIREPLGVVVKNATFKSPKPPEPPAINPPPETDVEKTEETDVKEEPEHVDEPEKQFNVRFNAGGHGDLYGQSEYYKPASDTVKESEVPEVVSAEGYRFTGWDKEPVNHTVTGDIEFTAKYEEIPPANIEPETQETPEETDNIMDDTTDDTINDVDKTDVIENVAGGCFSFNWLNWLLLLLLLALIFMVIWCGLLDKCNFCLCCGNDNQTTIVEDTTSLNPEQETKIKPEPTKPCNAQVQSGGYEGYAGVFDMRQPYGTFVFEYNTHTQPDEITIYNGETTNGKEIFYYPMGGTNGECQANVKFDNQKITVKVIGSKEGTIWDFTVNCPDNKKN